MDYTELSTKIDNKDYNSKLVFPFSHTVNEYDKYLRKTTIKLYHEDEKRLHNLFTADLRSYVESELGKTLTDKQWIAIYDKAWGDGHSSGYGDVLGYTSGLIDIVKEFI